MNEHIAARCPLNKSKTFFVVEPFDLSHFLAHYSDSFFEQMPHEDVNVGHYTKMIWGVKLHGWPEIRALSALAATTYLPAPFCRVIGTMVC